MKNVIAYLLFVILFAGGLLPKVGMEQAIKANELVKHFQDHKKQAPAGFSFVDFLWMHYAADSKHAKTTKHPSLPSFDFTGAMGYVLPAVALFFTSAVALILVRRRSEFYENNYHFSMERVLIAPPRF
ncbi:hypothetical protein SKC35_08145 [Aquirufa sp. KTFRIE-69F]|uniref:Uncharacterized protein n=1 Tax=Aquirufa originis TaxID=3096514 RepID=A0ABW6D6I1_9BACT